MEVLIIAIIAIAIIIAASKIKKTKDGRIKDESVTTKVVNDVIATFSLDSENSTKNSVMAKLNKFLPTNFATVSKGPELHGIKADFLIGSKIVVMIEMQKTLTNTKGKLSEVVGNIQQLQKNGYKDKIIVLVATPKNEPQSKEIVSRIEDCNVSYREIIF